MDRNDLGEVGEIGGVVGSKNVSPDVVTATGGLFSTSMNFPAGDSGVVGGVRILT